ncbi:MAG: hypothetical protein AB3N23_05620 [Paracoccaceae bacterium]
MAPFEYRSDGRNPRTIAALAVAWVLLLLAYVVLNAAPWILALLAATTLPAIRDLWMNPQSGLRLDETGLTWSSGRRTGEVALPEIAEIRLDRTWDFCIRASIVLKTGKKVRLPAESTPPDEVLEQELTARNIPVSRHPFSLF